jgi:thioredoxin 2
VLAKVNSDESPRTSVRYRIRSIPTLLLLRGGQELKRQSGVMPAAELVRWAGV